MDPHYGMNRRDLDYVLLRLGGAVSDVRGTGEIRYSHPLMQRRPRGDKRRKDAPSHLVDFVLEIHRRVVERADAFTQLA